MSTAPFKGIRFPTISIDSILYSPDVAELGRKAHEVADIHTANAAWSVVLADRERTLADDHPDLQSVRADLAGTISALGDLAAARVLEEKVLAIREKTLAADHRDLQAARLNLAGTLYAQGELPAARELFEKVLAVRERTLGADDPDLQLARQNLAVALKTLGDLQGARALEEKVLAIRERTLADDHPDLQAARLNLAITIGKLGELKRARELEEKVLAIFEKTLPEDHPSLQSARANLANTLEMQGDLHGALALEQKVLTILQKTLPDDHPSLQGARLNLASTLQSLGDLRSARVLEEKVLAIFEKTLPDDHPDVQVARENFAATIGELGDLQGARVIIEKVLAVREKTLPEDHPDLQRSRQNLAYTMGELGDQEGARALEERVLAILERTQPDDDPDLQRARQNLASSLYASGEFEAARALFEKVLAILERTLPAEHPILQQARENLGSILFALGDSEAARVLEEQALAIYERTLPEDHPDVQSVRENVALTRRALGDLAGARALEERVIAIFERTRSAGHPELLKTRENLAWTLSHMGDLDAVDAQCKQLVTGIESALAQSAALSLHERSERLSDCEESLSTVLALATGGRAKSVSVARLFGLIETMRVRSTSGVPLDSLGQEPALMRAREARARLNDAVTASADPDRATVSNEDIGALVRQRDLAERELAALLVERGMVAPEINAKLLAAALPKDARAIGFRRTTPEEFHSGPSKAKGAGDSMLAFVLAPDGNLVRVELGSLDLLQRAIERWRATIGKPLERGAAVAVEDAPTVERAAAQELGRRLFDPLLAAIGDARELFVCLDGPLHLLPIDALPLEDSSSAANSTTTNASTNASKGAPKLAGERWKIHCESSFARLVAARKSAPREAASKSPEDTALAGETKLLAIGGVNFNAKLARGAELPGSFAAAPPLESNASIESRDRAGPLGSNLGPLPATNGEVEAIGALFEEASKHKPLLLLGERATKRALFDGVHGASFVHIATHGYFVPDVFASTGDARPPGSLWSPATFQASVRGLAPMTLCGLALAGANRGADEHGRVPGVVTAEELASFDLASCELAVLSACETNVGITRAGQGIQSLQAALHAAGARTAITSLWKVDDSSTRELFEDFYTRLWVGHESKSTALWNAKMALRRKRASTRDWAAWVLTGDPD